MEAPDRSMGGSEWLTMRPLESEWSFINCADCVTRASYIFNLGCDDETYLIKLLQGLGSPT